VGSQSSDAGGRSVEVVWAQETNELTSTWREGAQAGNRNYGERICQGGREKEERIHRSLAQTESRSAGGVLDSKEKEKAEVSIKL